MTAPACGAKDAQHHKCTRPAGHAGGHLDEVRDVYWQAEEDPEQDADAAEAAVNARLHDDNREHAREAQVQA